MTHANRLAPGALLRQDGKPVFFINCAVCGNEFNAVIPYAKYCSSPCRQKAHYYRARRRPMPAQQHQPALNLQPAPQAIEGRQWNGVTIQRRQSDGFINATAMCKAGGKRWNHYASNERTEEYMVALQRHLEAENPCGAAVAGNPATLSYGIAERTAALIDVRQSGRPDQQGTWIHPRLAVDLARWISPAFAVWMDGWFLEQFQRPTPAPAPAPALALPVDPQAAEAQLFETAEAMVLDALLTLRMHSNKARRDGWPQPFYHQALS